MHPLLILRHGETTWNAEKRVQGALDSPLTETGVSHAKAQGQILGQLLAAGWDLPAWDIRMSPQGRSRRPAELALQPHGLVAREDARLREIDVGRWSGWTRPMIAEEAPGIFDDDTLEFYDVAPGGEGIVGLEVRARGVLASLSAPSIFFTHGITSRVLRCLLQGLPASDFDEVEGGQGIIFFMKDRKSTKLTLQSPIPSV